MTRFTMFALALMMLASASAVVINEGGNCNMLCCKGTWTGAGTASTCTVSDVTGEILATKHRLHADSTAAFHRCYEDPHHANGCICQCADAAADFTTGNRHYTPESL
jgi:hypothetical protein